MAAVQSAEHQDLVDQLIADVGDVLTPTQRKALADHLQHLHGMQHS